MDTHTVQRTGKSPHRQRITIICGLVGVLMLAGSVQASGIEIPRNRAETMSLPDVPEVNFIVKVTNPFCPQYTHSWSYSSVEEAVKDTIPGEWWDDAYIPDNTSLRSAAIIIRSVIKYWVTYPQNAGYAYSTAGVDWQGGVIGDSRCGGILNTELNAQRHSRPSYNSNGATDATVSDYIVDITPATPVLIKTNRSVEKSSVECAKNSGDYKFCALQALFGDWPNGSVATGIDPDLSENRYARNLSTAASSPSGPLVELQAEAFNERTGPTNPRLDHAWLCLTNQLGHTGYCAMRAEPDNGTNVYISDYAGSPFLVYHVPFPASVPHYVWIYAYACGGPDDTVFAGMDGALTPGSEPVMTGWGGCTWQWKSQLRDGSRPVISPTWTGTNGSFHRFYLWMKEGGIRIDQVTLTQDRCWKPAGAATPPGC